MEELECTIYNAIQEALRKYMEEHPDFVHNELQEFKERELSAMNASVRSAERQLQRVQQRAIDAENKIKKLREEKLNLNVAIQRLKNIGEQNG